jgi:hypothetical protein
MDGAPGRHRRLGTSMARAGYAQLATARLTTTIHQLLSSTIVILMYQTWEIFHGWHRQGCPG